MNESVSKEYLFNLFKWMNWWAKDSSWENGGMKELLMTVLQDQPCNVWTGSSLIIIFRNNSYTFFFNDSKIWYVFISQWNIRYIFVSQWNVCKRLKKERKGWESRGCYSKAVTKQPLNQLESILRSFSLVRSSWYFLVLFDTLPLTTSYNFSKLKSNKYSIFKSNRS